MKALSHTHCKCTQQTDPEWLGSRLVVVLWSWGEGQKGPEGKSHAQLAAWYQEHMEGIPLWGPLEEVPGTGLLDRRGPEVPWAAGP